MVERIALIGDVHGCIDELVKLYAALEHFSLDEIHSLGDLIDRGPESGEVVDFARKKGIKLVKGNHEATMQSIAKAGWYTGNPDKQRTIASINSTTAKQENWDYLFNAPYLRAIDQMNVLLVHAGVWPNHPIYLQAGSRAVAQAQAINPDKLGDTVWYEKRDEKNAQEGKIVYVNWEDLYCGRENIVYGHSVYDRPYFRQVQDGVGWTYGIDTGVPFGGSLTALVLPEKVIVQVAAKKIYWTKGGKAIPDPVHNGGRGD